MSDNDAIDMFIEKLAESVTEKIARLFKCDQSIDGIFRNDIGFALSLMVRKYFDLTPKGKELLEMMNPEVTNMRMRNVIDYEVAYAIKAHEQELKEKDNEIAMKDKENSTLKKILEEHNIPY